MVTTDIGCGSGSGKTRAGSLRVLFTAQPADEISNDEVARLPTDDSQGIVGFSVAEEKRTHPQTDFRCPESYLRIRGEEGLSGIQARRALNRAWIECSPPWKLPRENQAKSW
jgi:hypothetical protein